MKIALSSWAICFLTAAAIAAPTAAAARGPGEEARDACPPPPHAVRHPPPPPGMMPEPPPPGIMPLSHRLRGIVLSEAQQDKLFALLHEAQPAEREQSKKAARAMDELHRLAQAESFDAARARQLADDQAKALAQLALLRAELDFKLQALLTPEQRRQLDRASAMDEPPRPPGIMPGR